MVLFSIALIIFFVPSSISQCDEGGTWSTWQLSENQIGYDYCGACSNATWFRVCISAPGCPCTGPEDFSAPFDIEVCMYPRISCCGPYTSGITNGKVVCGPVTSFPADTILPASYCPPSGVGVWGSWSEWSSCSAICGQFGKKTRIRVCLSEDYDCPCTNSDVKTTQCAKCVTTPCSDDAPCAPGSQLSYQSTGFQVCYPYGTPPSSAYGTWTEWSAISTANCPDCGGAMTAANRSIPAGTLVPAGSSTGMIPCGTQVCSYPKLSCNAGFSKNIVDNEFKCLPKV